MLPNVDSARSVVGDVRARGIDDAAIHVLANENTELGDLPEGRCVERVRGCRGVAERRVKFN